MANTKTFQGVTYTNGNLPKSLLAPLDGNNLDLPGDRAALRLDAAASWNRARAEVESKTGVVLTVRGWNRTRKEQERFYLERHRKARSGERICCYWDGVPYVFTGTAHASPPGASNHGWGLAVDVVDFGTVGNFNHPRRRAAIAILKRHGWTDDEGRGSIQEPWHLVYNPARDQHRNQKTPTQEDTMSAAAERQIDELHQKLLRKFTDADKAIDIVDGVRRDLVVTRRNEDRLKELVAANRGLSAAVEAMATSVGVDPKVITATVQKSVDRALADLKITLSTESE